MAKINKDELTPEIFLELFTAVGWDPPGVEQVRRALQNSLVTFTACEDGRAVGMVRLIGDCGMSFYIKDFAVHPDYQHQGIGRSLMDSIERYIAETIDNDWDVSLELISTTPAVDFYRKCGFEVRPCEWDGPGMLRMIRSAG